ncbi:MAG: hypothetical protein Q4G18_08645 [Myroides sp.]|nr:hypothetical protein [Myroides sp.]
MQIYAYVGEPPYVTNIFKLAHGEEINQKTLVDPRDSYSFEDFFNGTTIIITYDNERKQTYEWNGREPRNPYRRYGRNETVILTNEDYQEATPCNGSCD